MAMRHTALSAREAPGWDSSASLILYLQCRRCVRVWWVLPGKLREHSRLLEFVRVANVLQPRQITPPSLKLRTESISDWHGSREFEIENEGSAGSRERKARRQQRLVQALCELVGVLWVPGGTIPQKELFLTVRHRRETEHCAPYLLSLIPNVLRAAEMLRLPERQKINSVCSPRTKSAVRIPVHMDPEYPRRPSRKSGRTQPCWLLLEAEKCPQSAVNGWRVRTTKVTYAHAKSLNLEPTMVASRKAASNFCARISFRISAALVTSSNRHTVMLWSGNSSNENFSTDWPAPVSPIVLRAQSPPPFARDPQREWTRVGRGNLRSYINCNCS
eukprot:3903320-Rhodomonas_salina.2